MNQNEWIEQKTSEGRKFYFNINTKESRWDKPDALKSKEELECEWTEYFNKEGKPYYYNSKTNKSVWVKPKEYLEMEEKIKAKNTPKTDSNVTQLASNLAINLMNKIQPALVSNTSPINIPPQSNPLSEFDIKLKEIEEKNKLTAIGLEKLSKVEIEKLFKDLLRKSGITSTWKWEDCHRVLQNEEIWKAVKTFSEKRALFNDYIRDCKNREREEAKLKKDKLKVKFRQMLEEDTTLTSETKFVNIIMKFCYDERWRSMDERDRDEIFQDYLDDLEKREIEEKKILNENKMKIFRKLLEDRKLSSQTKWKDILLNFKNDVIFNSMEKYDRLKTFTDYITELEMKEKEDRDNSKKFMEYKNRENFRELLMEKVSSGEMNFDTKWKVFVDSIKDSAEYSNLIGQEGSTPFELFNDVKDRLKEIYKSNKAILKNILKANNIRFTSDVEYERFEETLSRFDDYNEMKVEIKSTLYNHMIKKLKDKDYHNQKTYNRLIEHLKSKIKKKLLKNSEMKYEDFINNIRENSKYSIINDEDIKKLIIEVSNKINSNDYKESNYDSSSSESGKIKARKNKRKKDKKNRKYSYFDSGLDDEKLPNIKKQKIELPVDKNEEKEEGEFSN